MDAPLSPLLGTNDREQRWQTFQQSLSETVEQIARGKFWFLASLLLPGILFSTLEQMLFGTAPQEGHDPYAGPRALLSLLAGALATFLSIGMVNVVRLWLNQQEAGWKEILQTPFSLWLKEVGLFILLALGAVLGFILFIIPGIWFILTYQFAFVALAADSDLSISDAFRKSKSITSGNRWKILVTSLLVAFGFWWRKGGKWALWALLAALGMFILATLTSGAAIGSMSAGMKIVGFLAAALGFLGILGLVVAGIYTVITIQYTLGSLIFFGLTNKQEAQASESSPEIPSSEPIA